MTTFHFQLENNEKRQLVTEEDYVSTAASCIRDGDSFYRLVITGIMHDTNLIVSSAVESCMAFACELYLKSLLYMNMKHPKKMHDLDKLYDALEEEIRDEIYELHPKGNCPVMSLPDYFYLQIQEWRKGFEVLRYRHELKGHACNAQFIMELTDTLRIIAAKRCREKIRACKADYICEPEELPCFTLSRTFAAMGLYACRIDSTAFQVAYLNIDPEL